ncbi:MAG TPA: hypothetical protein VN442_04715 [Bryobacteraceae bacterium]|nr:hypothetical protein [Bryobacteraceae bacterium]
MKEGIRWLLPGLSTVVTTAATWLLGLDWRWIVFVTGLVFWACGFIMVRKLRHHEPKKPRPSSPGDTLGFKDGPVEIALSSVTTEIEGLKVEPLTHQHGILISVMQAFDRDRGHRCQVVLTNLQKLEAGLPHTVAELHNSTGAFRCGTVHLDSATSSSTLHYSQPQRWWLVTDTSGRPRIEYTSGYASGQNRTRGRVEVPPGEWVGTIEVLVDEKKLTRHIRFRWLGHGRTELLSKK